jgi:hypothetical protein
MLGSSQWVMAMANKVDPHIDEETIEKYSRGDLSARRVAGLEEHLLICELCRKNLEGSDAYLAAMSQAAAKMRRTEKEPKPKAASRAAGDR